MKARFWIIENESPTNDSCEIVYYVWAHEGGNDFIVDGPWTRRSGAESYIARLERLIAEVLADARAPVA